MTWRSGLSLGLGFLINAGTTWHPPGGSGSASPSDLAAGGRPDGSHAPALYRPPHGTLDSGEGASERWLKEAGLMLDHDARKAAQDYLDAAHNVDATAWAVDVAHPNRYALDGTGVLPELFAESSPDVCPVLLIEPDPVDSDIRRCEWCSCPTGSPLHWPGYLIGERFSLSSVSSADAIA